MGSTLKINDSLTVSKASVLSSTLDVTNAATMGSTLKVKDTLTVSKASVLSSTLDVAKASTLKSTLKVSKAATLSSTLEVSDAATMGSTLKVNDTLTVSKASTLSSTLDVAKASTLKSTLKVSKAATLSSTLEVSDAATMGSTLKVNDSLTVSKASVLSSTLDVTDAATMGSTLKVNDSLTVSKASVLSSTLDVAKASTLKSTLKVSKAATLSSTLEVSDAATMGSTLKVNDSLTVSKVSALKSTLHVSKAATLNSTLDVTGKTTFKTDISMNGDVDISGDLVIKGNLSVYQTNNTMTINTTVNDYTLIITEDISLNGELKVSGDTSLNGELYVKNASTFDSILNVNGETTFRYDNTTQPPDALNISYGDRIDVSYNGTEYSATNIAYISGGDATHIVYSNPDYNDISGIVQIYKVNDGSTRAVTASENGYGTSIAVSSDCNTHIVGSPDNGYGAVWLYKGGEFMTAVGGENSGDKFGYSVSITSDGSYCAVGAPYANNRDLDAGKVYVYEIKDTNGTWSFYPVTTLTTDGTYDNSDLYGLSVSIICDSTDIYVCSGAINYEDTDNSNNNFGVVITNKINIADLPDPTNPDPDLAEPTQVGTTITSTSIEYKHGRWNNLVFRDDNTLRLATGSNGNKVGVYDISKNASNSTAWTQIGSTFYVASIKNIELNRGTVNVSGGDTLCIATATTAHIYDLRQANIDYFENKSLPLMPVSIPSRNTSISITDDGSKVALGNSSITDIFLLNLSYDVPVDTQIIAGTNGVSIKKMVNTNDYEHIGQHNMQLRIRNGTGIYDSRALEIGLLENGTGIIQANENGVGYNNLALNPVNGNVGIGTTSPTVKLHVSSVQDAIMKIQADNTNTDGSKHPYLIFQQDGSYNEAGIFLGTGHGATGDTKENNLIISASTGGGGNIYFKTGTEQSNTDIDNLKNADSRMVINSSGNVLIGSVTSAANSVIQSELNILENGVPSNNSSVKIDIGSANTTATNYEQCYRYQLRTEQNINDNASFHISEVRVPNGTYNGYGTVTDVLSIYNGNVGIGTTSPLEQLEVTSNDDSATIRVSNDSNSIRTGVTKIDFNTRLGYRWRSNELVDGKMRGTIDTAGSIQVHGESNDNYEDAYMSFLVARDQHTDGAGGLGRLNERMRITSKGYVGIGTTSPTCPLYVSGSANIGSYSKYVSDQKQWEGWNGTDKTSIYATNGVGCDHISFFSDERIKKNIVDVPDNLALQQVRDIPCRYYEYIDYRTKGTEKTIGFIAQEVNEVLPMAISKKALIIPDEYRLLENISWEEIVSDISGNNTYKMSSDLTDVSGVKYKFIVANDMSDNAIEKEIVGNSDDTFTFDVSYQNMFCFGKEVDDFHMVDKNKIFALHHSAIQEIDKLQLEEKDKVAALETKNTELETKVATLETKNTELETRINTIMAILSNNNLT